MGALISCPGSDLRAVDSDWLVSFLRTVGHQTKVVMCAIVTASSPLHFGRVFGLTETRWKLREDMELIS